MTISRDLLEGWTLFDGRIRGLHTGRVFLKNGRAAHTGIPAFRDDEAVRYVRRRANFSLYHRRALDEHERNNS
jgi:hypothetical protein